MANKNSKLTQNVPGKYYVDASCVYCGQCHYLAPTFFADEPSTSYMYVAKQPITAEEIALCERAIVICPVNAIGNDGD